MTYSIQQIRLPFGETHVADLHAANRALRERLTHALAIEYDWRYHDGPEWAARYWCTIADASPADTIGQTGSRPLHHLLARFDWPRLSQAETDDVRTIFRSLLGLVHPEAAPSGYLTIGDGLWQRILRAFRAGDRAALVTAWSETRTLIRPARGPEDRLGLQREHDRLARVAEAADARLLAMSQSFPFNMRQRLSAPARPASARHAGRNTAPGTVARADSARQAVVS
ncbi:hypothetical protein [uncultured Salinisphaera sp.]|uniref:hypothetical protein n=1 Tax=uncultured Salinisphaera sp. TaxID=359372 RepID=UPI0032B30EC1|tara:strand:- start:5958 stop:6638 length:681 start_codon:yes stop_codon:yes gene_type:complete